MNNEKIIIEKINNETINIDASKTMDAINAVHLLATALVHLTKEYKTVKDKEDFLRIIGMYYEEINNIK